MYHLRKLIFGVGIIVLYGLFLGVIVVALALFVDPINSPGPPAVDSVSWQEAITITADIGTGGSPSDHEYALHANSLVWVSSWAVRAVGWIVVPAIIGYLVSQAVVELKLDAARRQRPATLDELADAADLTEKEREAFRSLGLRILEEHEEFIFGPRR